MYNAGSFDYEYNLTDHLGNVRVSVNQGGSVVQKDDYYPFGLTFNSWKSTVPANQYTYNGKEEQKEWGVLDYEWRNHDPALSRFISIDPHADRYLSISPYNYAFNSPVMYVDPDGRDGTLYLQVLTDQNGEVSAAAKKGIEDAVNKLVNDFITHGIEAKVRVAYSNDIISKSDFENRSDYHKGDSYTLLGTASQLKSATKTAAQKGWEDLQNKVNGTKDGSSGREQENFSIVNLDNSIDSKGNVNNKFYNLALTRQQDFKSVGEKLFHIIRHETGHDKLFSSSDVNTFGGHSTDKTNMLHTEPYRNQTYSKDQIKMMKRLHNGDPNLVGPPSSTGVEPMFRLGIFMIQN